MPAISKRIFRNAALTLLLALGMIAMDATIPGLIFVGVALVVAMAGLTTLRHEPRQADRTG